MSLTLPIQVGKQYVRRDGAVVTIRVGPTHYEPSKNNGEWLLAGAPGEDEKNYSFYIASETGLVSPNQQPGSAQDLIADHIPATGHPHAALMAQYAADACETAEPWLRWQFSEADDDWHNCGKHPEWRADYSYRHKLQTIRIGEHDVPEPLRRVPEEGTFVFAPAVERELLFYSMAWDSHDLWCSINLTRGLVHLTREAAEQHARALLAFTQAQA